MKKMVQKSIALGLLSCLLSVCWAAPSGAATGAPVLIGFDGAYGQKTNTSPQSIEWGIRAAIDEINAAGGVLNGRPLSLVTTDNKGVSVRGKDNFVELAGRQDLVAVLEGKYSPVSVEVLPDAHRLKVPLISVWGSADQITDHSYKPSYSFRVSLKDSWGVEAMIKRLALKYKADKACVFLPNTSWGRSSEAVIRAKAGQYKVDFNVVRWYNWGDVSFVEHYRACLSAGSKALMFVGNEKEAALLLRDVASQPPQLRLPMVSHWGVSGGVLHELAGEYLGDVTFDVIQTFTFVKNSRPRAKYLGEWIRKNGDFQSFSDIPSPVGAAQAYDAVHLLAMAVNKAQSTQPVKVRDALEKLPAFEGAVRHYTQAFTPARHDALDASQILFVKMDRLGRLIPIE